jgi:hypothetical protein
VIWSTILYLSSYIALYPAAWCFSIFPPFSAVPHTDKVKRGHTTVFLLFSLSFTLETSAPRNLETGLFKNRGQTPKKRSIFQANPSPVKG